MAKYYYNGVLLPEIPAEVLTNYPYCWIRDNTRTGHYDLCMSSSPWYASDADTIYTDSFSTTGIQWYRITKNTPEESWMFNQAWTSSGGFGNESDRYIMWSNHDIPNGSVTSTTIYFYASAPVPEGNMFYGIKTENIASGAETKTGAWTHGYKFAVNMPIQAIGCRLVSPTAQIMTVKLWNTNQELLTQGNATRVEAKNQTFLPFQRPVDLTPGETYVVSCYFDGYYRRNVDSLTFSPDISFVASTYLSGADGYPSTENATTFYGFVDLAYTKPNAGKFLIRSNSTLYTITDGALTALAETEITASLFQTYGVDDLPDGALLVGLTDPEVLYWQDSTDELPDLTLTVKGTPPLPQVFTSEPMDLTHESIAGISHAAVDASEDVRFAISFDGGTTWKAFDGAAWFDTSDTVPGMLPSTMNAITAEQWAEVVVLDSYMVRFWLPNVTAYVKSVVMHYINP